METEMTQANIKALETIIGKIEVLQHKTRDQRASDKLRKAKDELLDLLREC